MNKLLIIALAAGLFACTKGHKHHEEGSGSEKDYHGVYFIGLKDGAEIKRKSTVRFGVNGMKVKPASEGVVAWTGHHHLIIDDKAPAKGTPVSKDKTHLHFGAGQSETKLNLKRGAHTLTLQFADGAHMSYGPEWSKTITVNVK